jgi:hypothetical protein
MIATYPYSWDDAKEWRKELALTMIEKELEKLKMGLKKVVMKPLIILRPNFKNHLLLS